MLHLRTYLGKRIARSKRVVRTSHCAVRTSHCANEHGDRSTQAGTRIINACKGCIIVLFYGCYMPLASSPGWIPPLVL